ncbi:xanthine dehydrogenase accessory protein XdhC [Noviherbaspirillum sp.]|uniref:xanthine dehydrogenase accessory protein XdhC n=1 Tax=Noviherbaspirillum sp. TaxID=1926288 RepID=UPI002FE3DD2A
MNDWLSALLAQHGPAVLVTVARSEGSVPREAGAKMLVTEDRCFDTVGGGHLEFSAIGIARRLLSAGKKGMPRIERLALGPTLGQCCGGVVHLAFEYIDIDAHAGFVTLDIRRRADVDCWRLVPLDGPECALIATADAAPPGIDLHAVRQCRLLIDAAGRHWLIDPCLGGEPHLYLFGAGHVGAAIVRVLEGVPCRITWVDEREELFPHALPPQVAMEVTDTPEALIDTAPPGTSFLVMTHSHGLDQRLAESILRRADIGNGTGWFGLIGSRTKRIQFERRLRNIGIAPEVLARMICPIGMPGIEGKTPAVIAVAVAAQLLQVWEQQMAAMHAPGEERTA